MAHTQSALNAEPCFVAVGISVKGHELHFPKVIIKSPYVHINSACFQHSTESVISVQTPVHSPEALGRTYFPPALIKRKVSSVRAVFDSFWFGFVYSTLTVNTRIRSHHPPFPCLTANRLMPEHLTLFYMQNISASKPGVPQCLTRNTCKGEMGHSKKRFLQVPQVFYPYK